MAPVATSYIRERSNDYINIWQSNSYQAKSEKFINLSLRRLLQAGCTSLRLKC